jgi:RNA polymerase sigma-70 factor (ECF subfamily)
MGEVAELDDRDLVQAFKSSGDGASFGVLFNRYSKRLYTLAHRIHRDHARAEDCVQETFLKAIEEIDRFDERSRKSSFSAWVFTIATHVCLDEIRRTRRRLALALEAGGEQPIPRALSPEQQSMISELRAELYKLAPENRSCFLLHLDGYSYHEIGKLTGYTKARVRTSIQTAKRHIKRRA